jgi:hypothetical protein
MEINSERDFFITVTGKMNEIPSECLGLLIKWTIADASGGGEIQVEDERVKRGLEWREMENILYILRPFLDADKLDAGCIVPLIVGSEKEHQPDNPAVNKISSSEKWNDIEEQLKLRGIDSDEIKRSLEQWKRIYSDQEVLMALAAMEGRKLSKPLSYMGTILSNFRKSNGGVSGTGSGEIQFNGSRPRPVKKYVRVGPRAGWTLEGWTSKTHPKAGPGIEGRKQVWRSETGTLSYRNPNLETCEIPSFEEDAGVYEID